MLKAITGSVPLPDVTAEAAAFARVKTASNLALKQEYSPNSGELPVPVIGVLLGKERNRAGAHGWDWHIFGHVWNGLLSPVPAASKKLRDGSFAGSSSPPT